jgi:hypothetical protein
MGRAEAARHVVGLREACVEVGLDERDIVGGEARDAKDPQEYPATRALFGTVPAPPFDRSRACRAESGSLIADKLTA